MSTESEDQQPGDGSPPSVADVVAAWNVPAGASVALRIRDSILEAIAQGYDDPQLVADLAVGPLVIAVGRMENELAEARRRIDALEQVIDGRGDAM